MDFKQFQSQVYESVVGAEVQSQISIYGQIITETVEGRIFVDGVETSFVSLEEARENIKQHKINEDIQRAIQQELYESMSDNKIADLIKEHHGRIKVTDTLIESYVELASSKLFTTDPVAQSIRKFNKLDRLIEGRLDYKLNDGTSIVITEETQEKLNNVFGQHNDVVEYMRESKENFLSVLNQIEE